MCFNTGMLDRVLRIIVGLGLIGFGISTDSTVVALIGSIPLLTGAIGFCPLYPLFKLNTGCKKDK